VTRARGRRVLLSHGWAGLCPIDEGDDCGRDDSDGYGRAGVAGGVVGVNPHGKVGHRSAEGAVADGMNHTGQSGQGTSRTTIPMYPAFTEAPPTSHSATHGT
jgi:hypothetical protein